MRVEAPRRIWFRRRSGELLYHSNNRLGSVAKWGQSKNPSIFDKAADGLALASFRLALAEGSSIRSIERITGVHRDTIMRPIKSAQDAVRAAIVQEFRNLEPAE
jgi:hypothetical protein